MLYREQIRTLFSAIWVQILDLFSQLELSHGLVRCNYASHASPTIRLDAKERLTVLGTKHMKMF